MNAWVVGAWIASLFQASIEPVSRGGSKGMKERLSKLHWGFREDRYADTCLHKRSCITQHVVMGYWFHFAR